MRGADEENRDFERSLLTDASGLTEVVSLPAPPRELSLHYGSANTPYAIYDVSVLSDGYYPKNFYNVAVFSGTEAYLPVSMIPLTGTESAPEGNLSIVITENGYLEG
jgi:hypothetical protein